MQGLLRVALLLQRRAHESFFAFRPSPGTDPLTAVRRRQFVMDGTTNSTIPDALIEALIAQLTTRSQTHDLVVNTPSVVLLERRQTQPFPVAPSTVGLGWLSHVTLFSSGDRHRAGLSRPHLNRGTSPEQPAPKRQDEARDQ